MRIDGYMQTLLLRPEKFVLMAKANETEKNIAMNAAVFFNNLVIL